MKKLHIDIWIRGDIFLIISCHYRQKSLLENACIRSIYDIFYSKINQFLAFAHYFFILHVDEH